MENRIFECIKLLSYLYFKLKVNFKHNIFNSCIFLSLFKLLKNINIISLITIMIVLHKKIKNKLIYYLYI